MDPRIREHAEIIVDHSIDVDEGDQVLVGVPAVAEELEIALYEVLGERGAVPLSFGSSDRAQRAYLRAHEGEFVSPAHAEAMTEAADASIRVRADENVTETSDVDPTTQSAFARSRVDSREALLEATWVLTQHPASGNAQLAEMSTEAYAEFVYDAVTKDWEAQRERQEPLVEVLDPAETVRIVSGSETDLTLSIAGNSAVNDYGEANLPGGEVFTAPVKDGVNGTVHFDLPLYHQGTEVEDVRLEFDDGQVVDHEAGKNGDVLTEVLETDEGARYLGELGIGMNRDIDRFTYNMLFDEKMGDTVHMAVGRAYPESVGEDNEANESATHVDMIVDMSEESRIEVDGEVIQRDGAFRWEEEFDS